MIEGTIIFRWKFGHELRVPLFHSLKDINHSCLRPISYRVEIKAGALNMSEAAALSEWLGMVPAVLSRKR